MNTKFDSDASHAPRHGLILLQVLILGLFCLFTIRFWFLQVHKGEYFAEQARENQLRQASIPSARGIIWDRNGKQLAVNEPSFALGLIREDCEDVDATLAKVAEWTNVPLDQLQDAYKRGKKRVKSFEPLVLATDLTFDVLAKIEANTVFYPGLKIVVRHKRFYPYGELMSHVLGYVAEANEEELEKDDGLALGDSVGKQGLEYVLEKTLRGNKGLKQIEVDALGREHNQQVLLDPHAGNNIKLSIDLDLQALVAKQLEGQAGAIVVMEPFSGQILALVSEPSYDNNLFVLGVPRSIWKELRDNPRHPIQNRTTQSVYPPGSVFKLFMTACGLSQGMLQYSDRTYCSGGYRLGQRVFHCWKHSGHGNIDLQQALVSSCDVYFYELGERMGIDRIQQCATEFGFGSKTGIDLPHERAGLVPSREWKRKRRGEPWTKGETLNVSIGQGQVLASPLQIARFLSALVNGGKLLKPTLVATDPPVVQSEIPLSNQDREFILDAMVETVKRGTARSLKRPDARIGGKTGTAQVVKLLNASKRRKTLEMPYQYRDHAWLASFGQQNGKSYVVVCMVEHGGHGGSTGGPMVRAIYEKLFPPSNGKTKVEQTPS